MAPRNSHLVDGQDSLKVLFLQGDRRLARRLGVGVPGEVYPGHGAEDDGCGALGAHLVDPAGDSFLRRPSPPTKTGVRERVT